MMTRTRLSVCALGVAGSIAIWQISSAEQAEPLPAEPQSVNDARHVTEALGGAERYLTHLSTDKPIYRPGERVYVRGVTLHAVTNQPQPDRVSSAVEITGPKGDVVASGVVQSEDGVFGFEWLVPEEQAGGQYRVKVSHPWTGDAPAERQFDIRAYRAPRLRSQIKFLRDGYGPGDVVVGTLEVSRAEGGVPVGAKVTMVVRVDGVEAYRGETQVDSGGRCVARFPLPERISRGEGSLAMVIEDGGVVESASKTIPILLQTVDLSIYPEGGELVAGLPNRVYFEAFTPAHKPADLAGVVVDAAGREVAEFRSEHEGRGRFTMSPAAGTEYRLQITEPAGIVTTYPLPAVHDQGLVLTSLDDTSSGTVRLQLATTRATRVVVTLSKRGQEIARERVTLTAGEPKEVALAVGEASGVLVATVVQAGEPLSSDAPAQSDAATWGGKPLAERLVFARPRDEVRIAIAADRPRYVPGGKATLTLRTTDRSGKPRTAIVGVTVTDDSVLEMIERREQAPRLPVMVLLEPDVNDLADAQVYLDPENERAPLAVDLLLGTQGWRRFALFDLPKFVQAHGDAARRVLALRMLTREEVMTLRGGFGGRGVDRFAQLGDEARAWLAPARAARDKVAVDFLRPEAEAAANGPEDRSKVEPQAVAVGEPLAAPQGKLIRDELQDALDVASEESARRRLPLVRQPELARGGALGAASGIRNDFPAVRVFAHQVRPNRASGERMDFAETLFWHAGLKTDDRGQATIEFDLNDAVTSFRVLADAFTAEGSLGAGATTIESVEPFYVEPKLPLEVTSGDLVLAPISLVNGTGEELQALLTVASPFTTSAKENGTAITLPADGRVRHVVQMPIGDSLGEVPVTLAAQAGSFVDRVTRTVVVKPLGFPVERGRGGLIEPDGVVYYDVQIPETVVSGSVVAKAVVYPTPLASMTEAMVRLIQEPSGCFEQTSSTIYPLVMAQQYFLEHQGVDPSLVEKSAEILERGYARLIGFESKGGGYEWFGGDPGHDALTAYGLMEFTDMARVRHVDSAMLARTRDWFLAQRDGRGGFVRKAGTLHTWLPDPEVANTYNTWALFESDIEDDFSTEVGWVGDAAERTKNTYVIALAANVLGAAGERDRQARLLDKLAGLQQPDGSLAGATVSVVGSGGDALVIETTALAVLAWLDDANYSAQVENGIQFLAEACKAGRFGSTQSTVLALRAITAYDRARATPQAPGALQLVVDGEEVGEPVEFTAESHGAIELPNFADRLTPGRHRVEIRMMDGSKMPFSVATQYFARTPESSADCRLDLSVTLADSRLVEGELTEARVQVANRTSEDLPNPIAIIGIPGGMEVRHDQLKELVKEGKIASYEVLGRDLALYWRWLKASSTVELPVRVGAAIPGRFMGPANRAYEYYTDEHKTWTEGLRVEIEPRQ